MLINPEGETCRLAFLSAVNLVLHFFSVGAEAPSPSLSLGETADASVLITNDSLIRSELDAGQRWQGSQQLHSRGANRGVVECTAIHQEPISILIQGEPRLTAVVCAFNKQPS